MNNNVIGQLQLKVGCHASSSVLPSLVLPSPAIQTPSPANGTGQSCSQQSTNHSEVEQPATPAVTYAYMVKLIHQKRKNEFTIRTWHEIFDTINSLRQKLIAAFAEELLETFQLGYIS